MTKSNYPEIPALRKIAGDMASSGRMDSFISAYDKCRYDIPAEEYLYRTFLISGLSFILMMAAGMAYVISGRGDVLLAPIVILISLMAAGLAYYGRMFMVKSCKDYRGALIDANIVHATGFMLTMAESNVPLKRMFYNLSNLGGIYGTDIALEATYILSLVEEDGMDIVSALGKAQASSPSITWQELLIGISGVYSGGGSLKAYLKGRYDSFAEQKKASVRKYNQAVQGLSSIFLSVVGIAAIFIALINLVFNMASLFSNDALVWLDALVIVPLGTFAMMSVLRSSNPEA